MRCANSPSVSNLVLLSGVLGQKFVYEVSDPLHPRFLCRLDNTSAHLYATSNFTYLEPQSATRTNLTIRWYRDGTEGPGGTIAGWVSDAVWAPGGGPMVYTVRVDSAPDSLAGGVQVWLWEAGTSTLLFTYPIGIGDCVCRFGLPREVLAISFDGQYLVAGHLTGKGSQALAVYWLPGRQRVATLAPEDFNAFWDPASDRLYVAGFDVARTWTPESGEVRDAASGVWSFGAGLSPDGSTVAYTAYVDAAQLQPRVFVYDLQRGKSRMLVDKPRSQVVFVRDGWVWYFEEVPCADCAGPTKASGSVFAMQLSTGAEAPVSFGRGEAPTDLAPNEFWPNS